jgi:hypothetical protein
MRKYFVRRQRRHDVRMSAIGPDDVRVSGRLCRQTLEPYVDRDWSVRASELEWDCRQTVAHISDAFGFYAAHLASRADRWLKFDVVPHADASNLHLVRLAEAMGEVLSLVADAAPDDVIAFHHSGMWDKEAICAMACLEAVVHTGDAAGGLDVSFAPPQELCMRIIEVLFPGAPSDPDPWQAVLWATGRAELPDRPRMGNNWDAYWAARSKEVRP